MKYLTQDSRGNKSRTLPLIWFGVIVSCVMTYLMDYSGTVFTSLMTVFFGTWSFREHTEKKRG